MKSRAKFTVANLTKECLKRFGFVVVSYTSDFSFLYRKGAAVSRIWDCPVPFPMDSLGAASRADWNRMIAMIDEKWPGILDDSHRKPTPPVRFFKAVPRVFWIQYGTDLTEAKVIRVIESHGVSLIPVSIKCGFWPCWLGMKKTFTIEKFWKLVVKGGE